MKTRRIQSTTEKTVLTSMIVNDRILGRIQSHIKPGDRPFRSKWSNLIGDWCLRHFSKYQKAPRSSIQEIFKGYVARTKDDDSVNLVEKFLSSLSSDYKGLSKEMNENFIIDLAAKHFNEVKMEKEVDLIQSHLLEGDVENAELRLRSFKPFSFSTASMIEVITDKKAWLNSVRNSENDVLIQYGGAAGEFFGPHLQRDGFVSFMGPEKRGKSYWLIDMAWRSAVLNKRRTLLYSVGDMSERQMMRRIIARAANRPLGKGEIYRPRSMRKEGNEGWSVKSRIKRYPSPITIAEMKKAMEKIKIRSAHSSSLLKMRCTPNSTTKVSDIETDIDELIRDGWMPDVVVIDYADILAPERSYGDSRQDIDGIWKALRRISQKYHMLVVTATQTNAISYDAKTITKRHFSEDKRKLAHVTGMIGINQTDEEKRKEIYRLNWVLLREGIYYESRCVTVAGNLAISNPSIISTW